MAALQWQDPVVVTEAEWSVKTMTVTIWPFTENLLVDNMDKYFLNFLVQGPLDS